MITIQRFSTKIKVLAKSQKNADIVPPANTTSLRLSCHLRAPRIPRIARRGDPAETSEAEIGGETPDSVGPAGDGREFTTGHSVPPSRKERLSAANFPGMTGERQ